MTMKHIFSIILGLMAFCQLQAQSWTADNGNGTFTNPLFYDEFTDPDLIRVEQIITWLPVPCMPCPDYRYYVPKIW